MSEKTKEKAKKPEGTGMFSRLRSNIFWIILVFFCVYIFGASLAAFPWYYMDAAIAPKISDSMLFIMDFYTCCITDIVLLFLLTWLIRSNRYIWKSFLLPKKQAAVSQEDILADYYGRRRNGFKMLGWGLLLGFLTNFFAIVCALIHGDIHLYFEAGFSQIPVFLFAFLSVLIQSGAEELWCRGFLYERLHERYPLWVSVAVNGVIFGLLHLMNDGVTALSIIMIIVCGISYSLIRWYSGSIWIAIGLHTAWNFTQNIVFGLPNSGLTSGVSLFHLDASTGVSNLIYDFDFGVEGGLPALFTDMLIGSVVIVLAARNGRLKELTMNRTRALKTINTERLREEAK